MIQATVFTFTFSYEIFSLFVCFGRERKLLERGHYSCYYNYRIFKPFTTAENEHMRVRQRQITRRKRPSLPKNRVKERENFYRNVTSRGGMFLINIKDDVFPAVTRLISFNYSKATFKVFSSVKGGLLLGVRNNDWRRNDIFTFSYTHTPRERFLCLSIAKFVSFVWHPPADRWWWWWCEWASEREREEWNGKWCLIINHHVIRIDGII